VNGKFGSIEFDLENDGEKSHYKWDAD